MTKEAGEKVLLTGGTGFIASHVLDCLLDHGYEVVVTARSPEKGQRILESTRESLRTRVSYVVVEDVAEEGAFDEAVKVAKFAYVVHTASPYKLHFNDPVHDCLDPAIKGTTGILRSIKKHAPSVKRVVVTSSSAAMLQVGDPPQHPAVYNESSWCNVTWEMAMDQRYTYPASKTFAESAAWKFVAVESPGFDLVAINNTYTFGPIPRSLAGLEALNTSNHRIRDLVHGHWCELGVPATYPVFTFVDVRDVALAHVRALTVPEAGGKRFYVVGGFFSNPRLVQIVRQHFPELKNRLPEETTVTDDFPENHWKFDNRRSREVLGIEYTSLEESVVDTVRSILEFERV